MRAWGPEVAAAGPQGDLAQLEVREELVPFGGGEITVLFAGPLGAAAGDERPVMGDHVFGVDRGVAHGGVQQGVPADFRGDVRRQPGPQGVGDEDSPESLPRGQGVERGDALGTQPRGQGAQPRVLGQRAVPAALLKPEQHLRDNQVRQASEAHLGSLGNRGLGCQPVTGVQARIGPAGVEQTAVMGVAEHGLDHRCVAVAGRDGASSQAGQRLQVGAGQELLQRTAVHPVLLPVVGGAQRSRSIDPRTPAAGHPARLHHSPSRLVRRPRDRRELLLGQAARGKPSLAS
jgi:hypothetical protein